MKLKKSLANQPWNHPLIAYMRSAFESKNHIAESTETRDSSLASGRAFYFMATFRGIATQECPKVSESRIGKNREHRAQAALEKWSVYGPTRVFYATVPREQFGPVKPKRFVHVKLGQNGRNDERRSGGGSDPCKTMARAF